VSQEEEKRKKAGQRVCVCVCVYVCALQMVRPHSSCANERQSAVEGGARDGKLATKRKRVTCELQSGNVMEKIKKLAEIFAETKNNRQYVFPDVTKAHE